MDINSYSYINYSNSKNIIASATIEDDTITFYIITDYFGDHFFEVSNETAEVCEVFDFSEVLPQYDTYAEAYEKAANYFNSLVSEKDMIPGF